MGEIKIKKGVPSYLLSDEAPATVEVPTPPAVAEPASQGASEGSVKKTTPPSPAVSPTPTPSARAAAAAKPPVTEPVSPGESDLKSEVQARNLAQRRAKAMQRAGVTIIDKGRPPGMGENLGVFTPPVPPPERLQRIEDEMASADNEAFSARAAALQSGVDQRIAEREASIEAHDPYGPTDPGPARRAAANAEEAKNWAQQDRSVAAARARVLREMRDAAKKE